MVIRIILIMDERSLLEKTFCKSLWNFQPSVYWVGLISLCECMTQLNPSHSTQDVTWFLDLYRGGRLNLDPPYQRKSVWTSKDKRLFMDTVMNNFPAPPVFLYKSTDDNGVGTYHVVDGKQRIETIIRFSENKIKLPDNFSDVNLQGKKFRDLEKDKKQTFWNYSLLVEQLPSVNDEYVRNVFERINRNSRKLMDQELRHARYDGWFITFAETETEKSAWTNLKVVTRARSKRMKDVQLTSELLMVVIEEKIHGFSQDKISEFCAMYDDISEITDFDEEVFIERVNEIREFLINVKEVDEAVLKYLKLNAHLYSLWGFLALECAEMPKPAEFTLSYLEFMEKYEAIKALDPDDDDSGDIFKTAPFAAKYFKNASGAATEQPQRLARNEALKSALVKSD